MMEKVRSTAIGVIRHQRGKWERRAAYSGGAFPGQGLRVRLRLPSAARAAVNNAINDRKGSLFFDDTCLETLHLTIFTAQP
jgi:hypothetical protein